MEIITFLVIVSNVILLAWGLGFFRPSKPKQKFRSKSKSHSQLPPKSPEPQAQQRYLNPPTLERRFKSERFHLTVVRSSRDSRQFPKMVKLDRRATSISGISSMAIMYFSNSAARPLRLNYRWCLVSSAE